MLNINYNIKLLLFQKEIFTGKLFSSRDHFSQLRRNLLHAFKRHGRDHDGSHFDFGVKILKERQGSFNGMLELVSPVICYKNSLTEMLFYVFPKVRNKNRFLQTRPVLKFVQNQNILKAAFPERSRTGYTG